MQKSDLQKRTIKDIRKDSTLKPFLKGSSRMKKADLITHIINQMKVQIKKPRRKISRKPRRKISRKPRRKISRKPRRKISRKPRRKSNKKIKLSCYQLDGSKKQVKLTSDEIISVHPKKIHYNESDWDLVTIPMGTLLMRGERKDSIHTQLSSFKKGQKRPIWYTRFPKNALGYIPYGIPGMLSVYKTKKSLKLLNLNSIKNFKKLIEIFKYDDTCIWPSPIRFWGNKTKVEAAKMRSGTYMRKILLHTFLGVYGGAQSLKKNVSIDKAIEDRLQTRGLSRKSLLDWDYMFALWLCNNGFDGWVHPPELKGLDPEEMICVPFDSLKLAGRLDLPKGKGSRSDRTKILNKLKEYLKTV